MVDGQQGLYQIDNIPDIVSDEEVLTMLRKVVPKPIACVWAKAYVDSEDLSSIERVYDYDWLKICREVV